MVGEESYILLVRVASARALEDQLQRIRAATNVTIRSTVILKLFLQPQVAHTRKFYYINMKYNVKFCKKTTSIMLQLLF